MEANPSSLASSLRGIAVFASALLLSGCTGLLFQPDRPVPVSPRTEALSGDELTFSSLDGTQLDAFYFSALGNMMQRPSPIGSIYSSPRALVVQWHDTQGTMKSHYRSLSWLPIHGFDLLTFDYRGYGASAGTVDTAGIYRDTKSMLMQSSRLAREKGLPLIVIGQGQGGSLLLKALQEVHPKNLRLIVIEGAIYSQRQFARERLARHWYSWPFQWFSYAMVTDRYRPGGACLKRLPRDVPVILVYGRHDSVVGLRHGEELLSDLNEPKELWLYNGRGHTSGFDVENTDLQRRLLEKLNEATSAKSDRDDHPDDIEVRQMVNHLIESEGDPIARPTDIVESAEVAGPCFDAIHNKVGDEIQN